MDVEWEEQVWKEAWAPRETPAEEECVGEQASSKRKELTVGSKKRIKLDNDKRAIWGEAGSEHEEERTQFLYSETVQPMRAESKQSKIKLLSGLEWMCSTILKELLSSVVEMVSLVEGQRYGRNGTVSRRPPRRGVRT